MKWLYFLAFKVVFHCRKMNETCLFLSVCSYEWPPRVPAPASEQQQSTHQCGCTGQQQTVSVITEKTNDFGWNFFYFILFNFFIRLICPQMWCGDENKWMSCGLFSHRTPLMLAVLNGHTECVYSLLNQGACVETQDRWGRTALHRGVRRSN